MMISLRNVVPNDLPVFFEQQLDPDANYMAAFTRPDPTDQGSFMDHWSNIMADEKISIMTIIFEDKIAGHVLRYEQFGEPELSYWLGKEYWGKGIATKALKTFLGLIQERPLYARVAKDNYGSIRVLEKCGFELIGHDKGFANARGEEIEELIFILR